MEKDEALVAECYISFEKLLNNIVAFSARKDLNMLDNNEEMNKNKSSMRQSEGNRRSEILKQVVNFIQEKEFTDKLWYCGN